MHKLLAKFHCEKQNILEQLAHREEYEHDYLNKIDSLARQVKDVASDDTQQMKDRFLPVINKIKEQLRA